MIDLIMPTIVLTCAKYSYEIKEDGTRDINKDDVYDDTLLFKFDIESLEKIIFRDGPSKLNIEGKVMYFHPNGLHLEDNEFIWIPKQQSDFLSKCKSAYNKQIIIEKVAMLLSNVEDEDQVIDEFD